MRVAVTCSMLIALIGVMNGASASDPENAIPAWTADGRFGSNCGLPQGGTDKTYCLVPFTRLIVLPERYHKKRIVVFGYLINYHGMLRLYPSRDRALANAPVEYVYVPPSTIPDKLAAAVERGVQVRVAGRFDALFEGPVSYLGRFDEVDLINPTE